MNLKSKILLATCLVTNALPGISQDKNTVISTKPRSVSVLVGNSSYAQTDFYYDDFGRIEQAIDTRAGGAGQDIVKLYEYDNRGRKSFDNLPFVISGYQGTKITDATMKNRKFYAEKFPTDRDKNFFYSKTEYDGSPLGLVKSQSSPGEVGNTFPTKFEYRLNSSADSLKILLWNETLNAILTSLNYGRNVLTVKETKVTESNSTEERISYEYTNKLGQVIATAIKAPNEKKRVTYYVYDEMGRRCITIPPAAAHLIDKNIITVPFDSLKRYCSITTYNAVGLPKQKWAPGKGWTSYVYDTKGRLIMTQEPNMIDESNPAENLWWFSKYDSQSRVIKTGTFKSELSADEHTLAMIQLTSQTNICDEQYGGKFYNYTDNTYPKYIAGKTEVYNYTYYDEYYRPEMMSNPYNKKESINNATPNLDNVIGLPTSFSTRVISDGLSNGWRSTVIYYDNDYNVIQTVSDLYPTGKEIVSNSHDKAGNVIQSHVVQQGIMSTPSRYAYDKYFTYDNTGRLTSLRQIIEDDTVNKSVVLAYYAYDDMGINNSTSIHNWDDETTYTYDLPGRLVRSQSNPFSYHISYRNNLLGDVDGNVRNGDIEQFTWKRNGNYAGGYKYRYDKQNQLVDAKYIDNNMTECPGFNEKISQYDLNGNIVSLTRTDASGASDRQTEISYLYQDPNSAYTLSGINVNGTEYAYEYDRAGNMTYDGYRDVHIEYNILGLPSRIFAGTDEIRYIYDTNGVKLASVVNNGSWTYYRSVMTYTQQGTNPEQLNFIATPDGFAAKEGDNYVYKYYKTDYQGNNRALLAYRGLAAPEIEQIADYYPFGTAYELNNLHLNKQLYGGKELQDVTLNGRALNLYDFHARMYDPMLGRWFNVDPALQLMNPYQYCGNNPIVYVDKDGEWFFLIPILLCATINVVQNWDAIQDAFHDGFGKGLGKFLGFASVGALQGAAVYFGGPLLGALSGFGADALNSFITYGNFQQFKPGEAALAMATNFVGGKVGSAVTKGIGSLLGKSTASNIASSIIGNNVGTLTSNVAYGTITTGSIKEGWQTGWNMYKKTGWYTSTLNGASDGVLSSLDPKTISLNESKEKMGSDKSYNYKQDNTLSGAQKMQLWQTNVSNKATGWMKSSYNNAAPYMPSSSGQVSPLIRQTPFNSIIVK